MKTFLVACVTAIVIAVIGGYALSNSNTPVDKAFVNANAVRVGA